MSWETRRNGRRYYYTAKRVNGKVVKTYGGAGVFGNAFYHLDKAELGAKELEAAREKLARLQALVPFDTVERKVAEYSAQVDTALSEMLTAAGYHNHRGQWRKRRVDKTMAASKTESKTPSRTGVGYSGGGRSFDKAVAAFVVPEDFDERADLVNAGLHAEATPEDELRAIAVLRNYPHSRTQPTMGNPILNVVKHIAGSNRVLAEMIDIDIQRQKEMLSGPNPSPIEVLLVERIIVCWLQVAHIERRYVHAMESPQHIKRYEGYDKLLTGATRRYNAALRTLAQVRRLQGQSLGRTRSAATGEDNALGARFGNLML